MCSGRSLFGCLFRANQVFIQESFSQSDTVTEISVKVGGGLNPAKASSLILAGCFDECRLSVENKANQICTED